MTDDRMQVPGTPRPTGELPLVATQTGEAEIRFPQRVRATAKTAAAELLRQLNDPDIQPALRTYVVNQDVSQDPKRAAAQLAMLRGTLTGIQNGNITLGSGQLTEPLQSLLVFVLGRLDVNQASSRYLSEKHVADTRYFKNEDVLKLSATVVPENGAVPHRFWSRDAVDRLTRELEPKFKKLVITEDGVAVIRSKAEALTVAFENVCATGICVDQNQLGREP